MYIYIYIYLYIYIFIYVYMYNSYVHVYIYIVPIHIHLFIYIYTHAEEARYIAEVKYTYLNGKNEHLSCDKIEFPKIYMFLTGLWFLTS